MILGGAADCTMQDCMESRQGLAVGYKVCTASSESAPQSLQKGSSGCTPVFPVLNLDALYSHTSHPTDGHHILQEIMGKP